MTKIHLVVEGDPECNHQFEVIINDPWTDECTKCGRSQQLEGPLPTPSYADLYNEKDRD